jgi:ElaB/YqjD/DUF883 family membrane-anchored ribosome-binding protein
MSRYETPTALRNDAQTLTEDAKALLEATSEITDVKVAEARKRLNSAIESSKLTFGRLKDKATESAQLADQTIRSHPYQSIAIAFGIGALLGFLVSRRD